MPRVKRGVTARAKHKKVLVAAKGFTQRRGNVFRVAKEAVMKAGPVCLPRSPHQEARLPFPVDRPYQRGDARARHDLFGIHRRPEESRHRHGPQGPGRHGGARQAGICGDRRQGQVQPRRMIAARRKACSLIDGAGPWRPAPFFLPMNAIDQLISDCARGVRRSAAARRARERQGAVPRQVGQHHRTAQGPRQAGVPRRSAPRARASTPPRKRSSSCSPSAAGSSPTPRSSSGWPPRRSTSRCRAADAAPAASTRSCAPGSASRRFSARSVSTSPTAPRSRTTGPISLRSTTRRTIRRVRCRTRSTSTRAMPRASCCCCARIRVRCRCATRACTSRRSRSSRPGGRTASTRTRRTRRCSTRSKACGSTRTSRSPTSRACTPTSCAASSRAMTCRCAFARRSSRSPSRRPRST